MSDQRQRELERAAAQGDGGARLQMLAERVRLGELSLVRPETGHKAWVRALMDAGILSQYAVVRVVPRARRWNWPFAGLSWWWIHTMKAYPQCCVVELARLSHRGWQSVAATDSADDRIWARSRYNLHACAPGADVHQLEDVVAWFRENLLEVQLERLPREVVLARTVAREDRRADEPRTWAPEALLREYASFPKGHEDEKLVERDAEFDLQRVLVTRAGRRRVWHAAGSIHWSGMGTLCTEVDARSQGLLRWGEPTCVRCRRKLRWGQRDGARDRCYWRRWSRCDLEYLLLLPRRVWW